MREPLSREDEESDRDGITRAFNHSPVITLLTGETLQVINVGPRAHHHLERRDHLATRRAVACTAEQSVEERERETNVNRILDFSRAIALARYNKTRRDVTFDFPIPIKIDARPGSSRLNVIAVKTNITGTSEEA